MREKISLRGAHVRALLGFIVISTIVECTQTEARADDTTSTVVASPPKRTFGEKGDVVLPLAGISFGGGLSALGSYTLGPVAFGHSSSGNGDGSRSAFDYFSFNPNADFFIARHFSIGGSIIVGYQRNAETASPNATPDASNAFDDEQISLGAVPRIGYAFPLNDHLTIWPRISGGLVIVANTASNQGPTPTPLEFRGNADLAILYHLDRHFFVAVTPAIFFGGAPKVSGNESAFDVSFNTEASVGFVL